MSRGRQPEPWYWKARKGWYVYIHGEKIPLGKDKDAADRQFHAIMAKQPEERQPPPRGSVQELCERFMDWTEKHRPKSYDWYHARLERFLKHIQGAIVNDIRPFHVQTWLDAQTWGDSYKAGMVTAIRRVFNWSIKQGYLDKNPILGVEKPEAAHRENIVTPEEFATLLSHIRDQEFRDLLSFVWFTGCRPQEAVQLEARHWESKHKRFVLPPKEGKGKRLRIIYVPDEALEIVERRTKGGLVFVNTDGNRWTAYAVSNRFDRLKKKIGRKIAMYDVRHSYVHQQLKNGVDPVTLATILGHKDTARLSRVYSNLSQDPEYLRKSASRMRSDGSPPDEKRASVPRKKPQRRKS
jgi:integrase